MKLLFLSLSALLLALAPRVHATETIARTWNEEILDAIRIDLPHPPVHARNLFHLSIALYDAWAAYDPVAVGIVYRGKHTAPDLDAARHETISYAAYQILAERYALSRGATNTLEALKTRMVMLGYDPLFDLQNPSTPAGLGNTIAAAISSWFLHDGALQTRAYKDLEPALGGYSALNPPLVTGTRGTLAVNINYWQPLIITNAVSQNNIPVDAVQKFLGSQWKWARPFALERNDPNGLWIDPGPPPHLGAASDAEFKAQAVAVIRASSQLTPDDGVTIDISPGVFGNNPLGENSGTGYPLNPVTGQPYQSNPVKRGDFARVLAEYWADGPQSETPPGHWNSIANYVADTPGYEFRLGGTGPVLDRLEWEVKLYVALNAALHDAACGAWSIKRHYDGWRPIAAVRYLGQYGQSSDPQLPSYHTNGLPLVDGLIELVTAETSAAGQRHAGLPVNSVVINAWPGPTASPTTHYAGVRWIVAADWTTYQKKTFVSPAFPGYVSGHSTFSRAAAEVMTSFTGSAFFPGGLGTFNAQANQFLGTELGPSQTVQLQWATYYDAADQAGISRIWGGIHPPVDDFAGRRVGAVCGQMAWSLIQRFFDGSIASSPSTLATVLSTTGDPELRCSTIRGLYYTLESASSIDGPFTPAQPVRAENSVLVQPQPRGEPARFFRVSTSLQP